MSLAPEVATFGDSSHESGDTGLTISGGGFGAFPGEVWIYENDDRTGNADQLTVGNWDDLNLTNVDLPSVTNNLSGTVYLFILREDLVWSLGFPFTLLTTATTSGVVSVADFLQELYNDELSDFFIGNRNHTDEPRAKLLPLINTGLTYAYATYKIEVATTQLDVVEGTYTYILPETDILGIIRVINSYGRELTGNEVGILGKTLTFECPINVELQVEYKVRPVRMRLDQDDTQVQLQLPDMLMCWLRSYVAYRYLAGMKNETAVEKATDFFNQSQMYEKIFVTTNTTNEFSSASNTRLTSRGFA